MGLILKKSFLILLLLIAGGELYWQFALPYKKALAAEWVTRNEFGKRAWPEYTSAPKPSDKKLVVLIGNSQSCGEERASDSAVIYPYYLKKDLIRQQIVLENWSIRGIRTSDMEILTTKAMVKEADLILLPINLTNFDAPENINLTYSNSDVNLLLAEWKVYHAMQHSLLAPNISFETWLNKLVVSNCNLIRSRTPVFTYFAGDMSLNDQIFYFGNPVTRHLTPDLMKTKNFRKRISYQLDSTEIKQSKDAEFVQRISTFMQFCSYLKQRAELLHYKGKIVFVWQPIGLDKVPDFERQHLEQFNKIAVSTKGQFGFTFYDHTLQLPVEVFETFAHFNATAHRTYSHTLAQLVKHELQ